MLTTTIPDHGP